MAISMTTAEILLPDWLWYWKLPSYSRVAIVPTFYENRAPGAFVGGGADITKMQKKKNNNKNRIKIMIHM